MYGSPVDKSQTISFEIDICSLEMVTKRQNVSLYSEIRQICSYQVKQDYRNTFLIFANGILIIND